MDDTMTEPIELSWARMYDVVTLADHRVAGGKVCAVIQNDPLGDVNRIVRICRVEGGKRTSVEAALVPITAGTTVTLCRDEARWAPTPGWRVDVDGHTVLRAADSDIWPQPPAPRVPMRLWATQAAKRACSERLRRLGDAIAGRFGYVRDEDRW